MKKQRKKKNSPKVRQEVNEVVEKVVDKNSKPPKEAKAIDVLLDAISFESTFSMAIGRHPENDELYFTKMPSVTVADKVHLFTSITDGSMKCEDMTDEDVLMLGRILDGGVERLEVFTNSLSEVIYDDLGGLVNVNLMMGLFNEINRVSQLFRVAQIALVAERGNDLFLKEAQMSMIDFAKEMVENSTSNPNRTLEEIDAEIAAQKKESDKAPAETKEAATEDD